MKNLNLWKNILMFWILLGTTITGYFYIFPVTEKYTEHYGKGFENMEQIFGPKVITHTIPISQISLLITTIGLIVIWWFKINSKSQK